MPPTEPAERTDATDPADAIDATEPDEKIEASDPIEPIDSTDAAEPTEPTERTDPTEPIDSTERSLAIERIEVGRERRKRPIMTYRPIPYKGGRLYGYYAPPMRTPRIDVHQHLWPEPFLAALEERTEPPLLRDGALLLDGEPAARFDPGPHDPDRRRAELRADGIDRALVCLSSPLGIETLLRAEAQPLLDAWHEGVFTLAEPFGVWGAVALDGARARDVDALLDRGAVGISLPAGAFVTARAVERVLP